MGKKKDEPERSIRDVVKDIVAKIGREADPKAVMEELTRQKVTFSESTVKQYVSAARVELGYSQPRGSGGGTRRRTDEPTLSDLLGARELCEELKMTPAQVHQLASKLHQFGDLSSLAQCLEALEKLAK